MKTEKETKSEKIKRLEAKIKELEGASSFRHHVASVNLEKCSLERMKASAVLVTIEGVNGKEIVAPVLISGGLSDQTIKALQLDILRSFNYNNEIGPKSVEDIVGAKKC